MSQWKLVPVEPTPEMSDFKNTGVHWQIAERIYASMLSAAPEPAQEPVAYLWQHGETGRTQYIAANEIEAFRQVVTRAWFEVGPLHLHAVPAPPTNLSDARDACPYCSDFQLGAIYFDQNCRACVKRMGKTPIPDRLDAALAAQGGTSK